MKSGNLNFLEPSGHVQACDGTNFYPLQTSRHFVPKNVGTGKHVINFASDKRFGLVIIGQTGSKLCAPTSIIYIASFRDFNITEVLFLLTCICR